MPKLKNLRREKFCQLYVKQTDFNATKAARGAGYSLLSCATEGSRLLQNAEIQARVDELMSVEQELFDMTAAEARSETAALAAFNMQDFYDDEGQLIPIHELPREVAATITEVEYGKLRDEEGRPLPVKIKAGGHKLAALDKMHRLDNKYEDDNRGANQEIHIHLDEKDMKA